MDILNAKKMKCIIQNIYEVYYPKVMVELVQAGISQEEAKKYTTEILVKIYNMKMQEGEKSDAVIHQMAISIINRELESILLPIFVQQCSVETTFEKNNEDSVEEEAELEYMDWTSETEKKELTQKVVRRVVEPQIYKKKINWVLVVILSILLTVICWTAMGALMSGNIIPRVDFGYTWFNKHIWNVF